jgi:hypothetical protein
MQTYFAALTARGSLGWRVAVSTVIADLLYVALRRKKELELANAHVLGRRARVKYGVQ